MRALKALVVAMGIAILVGTTVLVTLIMERGARLARGERSPAAGAVPGGPVPVHALRIPTGARVLESGLGDGRVFLRTAAPDGSEVMFVFDGATGRPVARYEIAPAVAPAASPP